MAIRGRTRYAGLADPEYKIWRPTMLSSLQWWLKADAITGVADGGTVASWPDASGNGYTLSQSTEASKPTLVANAVNGKPAVRFGGTHFMQAGNVFSIGDTMSLFMVYSLNSSNRMTLLGQENAGGAFQYEMNNGASGMIGTMISGYFVSYAYGARPLSNSSFLYCGYVRNGSGLNHTLYQNGNSLSLTTNANISYSGDGNKTIGRRAGGSQGFVGDLAELMVLNTAASTETLAKVAWYFGRKYGLCNPPNLSF